MIQIIKAFLEDDKEFIKKLRDDPLINTLYCRQITPCNKSIIQGLWCKEWEQVYDRTSILTSLNMLNISKYGSQMLSI